MTTALSNEQVSAETCKIVDEASKKEVENQVNLDDIEEDDEEDDDDDDEDAPATHEKKEVVPIDPTNKTSYIYQKKAEKARWSEDEVFRFLNTVASIDCLSKNLFIVILGLGSY